MMSTDLCDALPTMSPAQQQAIVDAPRNADSHRTLMAQTPAMHVLETGGASSATTLTWPITTIAWNVERCLFPQDSAAHIAQHKPHVVLLSEMDKGMARTGQRNTSAAMADALGMAYAYGVEFFEMGVGGPTERPFCTDDFNAEGWHGNAILSSAPFERLTLIRLDDHGHWFDANDNGSDPQQPRIGGRMAVAAIIGTDQGPACFVSTHLESAGTVDHRDRQFRTLMAGLETFAPGLPVIIGGDLNTGNHLPDYDWKHETLFETARKAGYHWDANVPGMTTRPSLLTPKPAAVMKLDWFCARHVAGFDSAILPSLDGTGRPLSDHDAVISTFTPS